VRRRDVPAVTVALAAMCGAMTAGCTRAARGDATRDPGVPVEVANDFAPPPAPGAVTPARAALRVVSFNVHRGDELRRLAREILDSRALRDADLFLLQEIESHPDEGGSRARSLARMLELNHVYAAARPAGDGGATHGLAILSRHRITGARVIELPRYDLRYNSRRRIALAATVDVDGRPVHVYDVHLDTRLAPDERVAQLRPVIDDVKRGPAGELVIVGGDLNFAPVRWRWRVIPGGRADHVGPIDRAMAAAGLTPATGDVGATARMFGVGLRLDALYARGAAVVGAGVAREVTASDHLPVWIDLAWPPPGRE
jgi:endonuclease/exonuclease/phosphatase family metal-dependent hydrolase